MKTITTIAVLIASALPSQTDFTPIPRQPVTTSGTMARFNINLSVETTQTGDFTHYKNHAAHEWRNDTPDNPPPVDYTKLQDMTMAQRDYATKGRTIIGEFQQVDGTVKYLIVWYYGNEFKSSSGSKWSAPQRWAYIRPEEEKWNGHGFEMPSGIPPYNTNVVTLRADNYQGIVDYLMARNTVAQIQDMMDRSKEYFPKNGAPEQ